MAFTYNGQSFETVWAARRVAAGAELSSARCTWWVQDNGWTEAYEDPETGYVEAPEYYEQVVDCGAEVVEDDRGWFCSAGHEHVSMEVQDREGWAYACDAYDAAVISWGGKTPVANVPGCYDPADVPRVARAVFG